MLCMPILNDISSRHEKPACRACPTKLVPRLTSAGAARWQEFLRSAKIERADDKDSICSFRLMWTGRVVDESQSDYRALDRVDCLAIPAFYFFATAPNSVAFWKVGLDGVGGVMLVHAQIGSRAHLYRRFVAARCAGWLRDRFQRALGLVSPGPFPAIHVFSQPYVKTETPFRSGELVG